MFKFSKWATLMVVILALFPFALPVVAQNYWMQDDRGSNIKLEIFKPVFDDLEGLTFLTSVWSFSGYIEVTDRLSVRLELPVSMADGENRDGETLVGNPYLGIERKCENADGSSCWIYRFGGRIPIAPDDKRLSASIGVASLYNRLEGFYTDMAALAGGIGYKHTYSSGTRIGINVGLVNLIMTDDDDPELFFDYNAEWWQPAGKFNVAAGISGRMILTEDNIDFGRRTEHQLGLAANVDLGKFRPGAHVRVPMEEWLTNIVDFIYGVNVAYEI